MSVTWTEADREIAGIKLHVARSGSGPTVLVLHHDIGTVDRLLFYDALAAKFDVVVPHHPGWGKSERPQWMRHPRDIAAMYAWLLADLGVSDVSLVGLGFGGWIAAEMASQAPQAFKRLVLVGAMGIKPPEGDIADQAIVSYIDYPRAGFHDQAAFDRGLWRCHHRSAGSVGYRPRNEFPHRLEALHVPPDAAASAGRSSHAGADHLGRRRPDRSSERRSCLCTRAARGAP